MTMSRAERDAWQQADRILDALFDLPPDLRPARMEAMDLAPDMRQRVERLLAALNQGDGVLDHPERLVLPSAIDALRGRRLGRWELEGEIGRGGMSVVYRAHSVEGPAGQDAAVKVLTLGALADGGRERFLREQEVLLRLRHPYIAPMHDAGIAADGTPWLAMARVEGERIDAWCDARNLGVAARVRLVLQVCEAVAHAHRNLVIHRDIKPSNVLVDDDGRVRLLDFGIARLADAAEGERTATALRALTPEYAAPEQFAGAAATTAMDVYGIGALLYRLLAGMPPRPPGRDHPDAPITQPSRAARGNGGRARSEGRHALRLVRGDLDAIAMKALAAEPEARYPGIDALADDLGRWLDGKPVRAQPPGLAYRLRKFVARNRLAVAAALMLVAALGAGVAGTLWQAASAHREAQRAQAAAEDTQAQLDYLVSVLDVLAPATEAGRELDRGDIVAEAALRARRELAARPALLANVELGLGDVAERIGDYPQADALYRSVLARRRALFGDEHRDTAEALMHVGHMLGRRQPPDIAAAERTLAQAIARLRRHAPGSGALVRALSMWANVRGEQDGYDDALAALAEAGAHCRALGELPVCEQVWMSQGSLASRLSRRDEALAAYRRLLALRRARYGDDHARTLVVVGELGRLLAVGGQPEQGAAMLREVVARQRRIHTRPTSETLRNLQDLGMALMRASHMDEARRVYADYLEQARQLHGERSTEVALGYGNLGSLYFADGRYDEAGAAYARSRDLYGAVTGPQSGGAVVAGGNLGDVLREQGRLEEARALQQRALEGMRRLAGPDNPRVASRLSNLGRTELLRGDPAAALAHYDRALAIYRQVQEKNPDDIGVPVVRVYRAQVLRALGRGDEALAELRAGLLRLDRPAGRERYYWEALALLTATACARHEAGCAALQRACAEGQRLPGLSGRPRQMLALAAAGRPLQ